MFGFVVYAWPAQLSDCWRLPMERTGFGVEELPNGGIVKAAGTKVKLLVGKDEGATIYGWSFSWTKRQKLAESVERILLASGMQAFCKPHSTNLIYRISNEPTSEWLKELAPKNAEICYAPDAFGGSAKEYHGLIKSDADSIRLWGGVAINPESKELNYYLAVDADASSISCNPFLQSFDSALITHGATRLDTQRKLAG
jgi:hypothetical protein